jgi:transcriptional regulator with XRE-family HTH domain
MSFFKWKFRVKFVVESDMNIGIVIKEVRKQKGLTQLDLSEHAKISVRTIQRIEKDEVDPSFYSLKSISEILEIDLLEIKNSNSMMFTKKILGIHLNDISMEQEENSNLEERLKTIESHLASIAGTRRKQLTIRKRGWIIAGIVIAAWTIIEVLAVFGLIG